MRMSDWRSDLSSSDLASPSAGHPVLTRARAIHGALVATPGRQDTAHLVVAFGASFEATQVGATSPTALRFRLPTKKPRQRIVSAASRPGYAESRPWMADRKRVV